MLVARTDPTPKGSQTSSPFANNYRKLNYDQNEYQDSKLQDQNRFRYQQQTGSNEKPGDAVQKSINDIERFSFDYKTRKVIVLHKQT